MTVAYGGESFLYEIAPSIADGKRPALNIEKIIMSDGHEESFEDIRLTKIYQPHSGYKMINFTRGGAGVGDSFERQVDAVREDVLNELVSVKSAREDYGVVIGPEILITQ